MEDYRGIVISGLSNSGKTTLATKLSEHFSWPVHSLGQLWRERWAKLYPQGEVSFEEYWRTTSLQDNLAINEQAREIFARGNVIGESRYSHYCRDFPALLVFVTADLETRAVRALPILKYPSKSLSEIKNILFEREQDEVRMGKKLYGESYDYRVSDHYDLVLNSVRLTLAQEMVLVLSLHP